MSQRGENKYSFNARKQNVFQMIYNKKKKQKKRHNDNRNGTKVSDPACGEVIELMTLQLRR